MVFIPDPFGLVYREPGTNWFAKTCDFKMCREARDYYLTNDELSLDNNASWDYYLTNDELSLDNNASLW